MSIQHADYATRVGDRFTLRRLDVHQPDVEATLTEVSDQQGASHWVSWSMTFDAPVPPEQGVFEVTAPGLEASELLLVPVGASPDGILLHATLSTSDESESDHG